MGKIINLKDRRSAEECGAVTVSAAPGVVRYSVRWVDGTVGTMLLTVSEAREMAALISDAAADAEHSNG